MSFFDFLRKTGIFRVGAESASYRTAADRPLSLQEGGVFNSEKDVACGARKNAPPRSCECPCAAGTKKADER